MMKWEQGEKFYFEWLSENLTQGGKIGVDPLQIGAVAFKNRSKYFKVKGFEMICVNKNLVD